MKNQKGGLKLKHPEKKGFQPIFDMMQSASAKISLLTYSSLKGFMIVLDVSPEDSEYVTLSGTRFTQPVTSFILKFAVITPSNDENLDPYKGVDKSSESSESYFEEAKLQQTIWKKSIRGARPELCPPVANFSIFDKDNSEKLVDYFKDSLGSKISQDASSIFRYLETCLFSGITQRTIGVIVMPRIQQSTTFGRFIEMPNGADFYGKIVETESINTAYANVAAQIARLFIDIGVVHFDLHSGNAMIYLTPDGEIKSVIIDFGRASNIMSDVEDEYLSVTEKTDMQEEKTKFFDTLLTMSLDSPDKDKRKFLLSITDYLADIDFTKNQQLFKFTDPQRYQMDWYREFKRRSYMPVKAFDILKTSTEVTGQGVLPTTIKQYEREGSLVNFDRGLDSFIIPFPQCYAPGGCTISGGKKCRKTKKYNKKFKMDGKTKKNRKNKKNRK
jgi:hypothetical protein